MSSTNGFPIRWVTFALSHSRGLLQNLRLQWKDGNLELDVTAFVCACVYAQEYEHMQN
jgi:hypothetical protein